MRRVMSGERMWASRNWGPLQGVISPSCCDFLVLLLAFPWFF
jgi:hypothetical protein